MKLTPAKVTMLMLVAVAGLIGMYIVKGLFAGEKKVERPRVVNIPLAAALLTPGTRITREHIGMGTYPERELKEGMLQSERVIVGRVVKEAIKSGSPLRGTQLYEPGENVPLVVADGKQAIAVPVKTSAEMVDGLIQPGNFVDVHFTLDSQNSGGIDARIQRLGGVSMTMFKGVQVLALNKNFRQGPLLASGNSVTLELAPEQTNVLLVTQARGSISLTYNPSGEGDGGVALNNADRATLWEVLGLKKSPRTTGPESEKPFVTETFKGVQGGEVLWGKDGRKFEARASGAGGYTRDR
ncbi:MAG TPA: Flp pilus assembly protein CpaB, partial [Planctomycetaceae bacterium]|nr:Flp pilus assembly protein CpaB [Planctomycetaceae bacterium]